MATGENLTGVEQFRPLLRRRRRRHRPGGRGLGRHALAAARDRRARHATCRSVRSGYNANPAVARGDGGGAQPPDDRGPGRSTSRPGVPSTRSSSTAASCWATSPARHPRSTRPPSTARPASRHAWLAPRRPARAVAARPGCGWSSNASGRPDGDPARTASHPGAARRALRRAVPAGRGRRGAARRHRDRRERSPDAAALPRPSGFDPASRCAGRSARTATSTTPEATARSRRRHRTSESWPAALDVPITRERRAAHRGRYGEFRDPTGSTTRPRRRPRSARSPAWSRIDRRARRRRGVRPRGDRGSRAARARVTRPATSRCGMPTNRASLISRRGARRDGPDGDGRPAFPPTYRDTAAYVETIDAFRAATMPICC